MRNNNWFGPAIAIFAIVFILAGTFLVRWHDFDMKNKEAVNRVLTSQSVLDTSLTIQYAKPPVYSESYHMHNDNGVSMVRYRVQGYSGKVVTITLPPDKTYLVSFFFQEIVQDGIWQITNRPDAGNTDIRYTLRINQIADKERGSRTITFTDPHYWATTAGRQYHIVLAKNGPTPDLTKLQSTTLADPRFQEIVNAFRAFGPPSFRDRIKSAQVLVRSSH